MTSRVDPDTSLWPDFAVSIWPFTGAPTAGSWMLGRVGVDNTGTMYVCTAGGSPGTWVAVGSGGSSVPSGANVTGSASIGPGIDFQLPLGKNIASGNWPFIGSTAMQPIKVTAGGLIIPGTEPFGILVVPTWDDGTITLTIPSGNLLIGVYPVNGSTAGSTWNTNADTVITAADTSGVSVPIAHWTQTGTDPDITADGSCAVSSTAGGVFSFFIAASGHT
jgi:hypothetical protein